MASGISAERKIDKARSQLIIDEPFFGIIALGCSFVEAPWCKTAATDGFRIYWARDFFDKLTEKEVKGVVVHEILHIAWLHMLRVRNRDLKLWNIAADCAINQAIIEGKFTLPKGGIDPNSPQFSKYKDWNVERIYQDLFDNAIKVNFKFDSTDGSGDGETWGAVIPAMGEDGKPLSEDERSAIEHDVKERIMGAARFAKQRGKLPGSLEGLIEAAGKPKIDWKNYIQFWVSGVKPNDYTWTRPNRKMLANHGVYMPRMKLTGAGHGVLSIDESGSVSDDELRDYTREIAGMIEVCNPEKLTIILHDAVVTHVYEWNAGDDFSNLKVKGRGGTRIQPSFDKVKTLDEPVDWMICFTDMGICDFPSKEEAPNFPVLWCATGDDIAPFGTYLDLRKPEL